MHHQKILVVGLGKSGIAASNYLLAKGCDITAVDSNIHREEIIHWYNERKNLSLKVQGESESQEISSYDLVIVSPGIPQKHPLYKEAIEKEIPVFSEAELAFQIIKERDTKCIGITGSNGKTTLTLFLEHLLSCANTPAKAIGNVGLPFTQYLLEKLPYSQEVLVCELSSYHLETLSAKALDIGILLDITPDHLDRYHSFEAYSKAKLNMIRCIKPEGTLFLSKKMYILFKEEVDRCEGCVIVIPEEFSNGDKNSYLQLTKNREYCDFLGLVKEKAFSLESLYLAKAVLKCLSIKDCDLAKAITTFKKPAHRLELIRTIDGVKFINDSKATNIESVIYAVKMLEGDILLIAGGKDKGLSFSEWKTHFGSQVSKIFAIGESAMKIKACLEDAYDVQICEDLERAINEAFAFATPKSNILLSPGCASFDSYRDYTYRGESFREIVTALNERCTG